VVLGMDHSPKVFVARADIFRNPKIAKILKWLKIMPIMRMRDGYEEVKKNNETIERAVDVLRDRVPFCIFPEGTHQTKYSSLPLAKGIFRIAFQAQELMPDMPLYIVPVGIRYGSFFRFRSTVRVQIGEPINVGRFIKEHSDLAPAEQMTAIRELLTERIHNSIFYIPNDEDYEAMYEICATVVKHQTKNCKFVVDGKRLRGMDAHFEANNRTVREVMRLKESNPEVAAELLQLGKEAYEMRTQQSISLKSVSAKNGLASRIMQMFFFILKLPYTIPASILTLPMVAVVKFLFTKIKDHAFRNSIRFLINLVLWPILMIIYAAVAYSLLPWEWALPITLALLPAPIVAQETWRMLRLFKSDIKLHNNNNLRDKYKKIRTLFLQNR
ncbi:MAG: 1-acyl-sn-glycerol-3-phosphate acyltransferase, partial [Alistipes sp.]|nr:1-acyl-sn-glycerol-3-phosphate acyltransferase [Alistipes sp.]